MYAARRFKKGPFPDRFDAEPSLSFTIFHDYVGAKSPELPSLSTLISFSYPAVRHQRNNRHSIKMNYTFCSLYPSVQDPPTKSPNCAVGTWANQSAVLKSCCGNGPIGNYSWDQLPTYCFQYCNITDPTLTVDDVSQCLTSHLSNINMTTIFVCGTGQNVTSSHSSASRSGMTKLGWILLALAMTGVVWGTELAV